MTRRKSIGGLRIALGMGLLLGITNGCVDGAEEGDDRFGSTEQEIISGYFLPQASANVSTNMVSVGCSAVALDSQWILTAAHCGAPSSATLYYPSETKDVRDRVTFPNTDVALLRVHPFGSGLIKPFQLWSSSLSPLVGQTLTCVGQGRNTYTGGSGTWRWAELVPSSENGVGYSISPNAGGQIQWKGDSGGPCLLGSGSSWKVTGIQSTCTHNETTQEVSSCFQNGLNVSLSAQVEDYRQRSSVIFYNSGNGATASAGLTRTGAYDGGTLLAGSSGWSHSLVLRNGVVLFYSASTGSAATIRVEKNGVASSWLTSFMLAPNITHLTAVGPDRVFLYRGSTGTGYTARISTTGAYTPGQTINGFNTNFVHVVGTKAGGLFLLTNTGTAATATIDANLVYTYAGSVSGFSPWTHVTSVNDRGLFLYNSTNGGAYTAQLTTAGVYQSFAPVSGLASGNIYAVGGSNGTILFVNGAGVGSTGKIDPTTGSYTPYTTGISGFSTNWTSASAE